jgi:predicted permease
VCHKVASNLPEVPISLYLWPKIPWLLVALAVGFMSAVGIGQRFHTSWRFWPEVSHQLMVLAKGFISAGDIGIGFISPAAAAKGFMSAVGIGQKFHICWCYIGQRFHFS